MSVAATGNPVFLAIRRPKTFFRHAPPASRIVPRSAKRRRDAEKREKHTGLPATEMAAFLPTTTARERRSFEPRHRPAVASPRSGRSAESAKHTSPGQARLKASPRLGKTALWPCSSAFRPQSAKLLGRKAMELYEEHCRNETSGLPSRARCPRLPPSPARLPPPSTKQSDRAADSIVCGAAAS